MGRILNCGLFIIAGSYQFQEKDFKLNETVLQGKGSLA